MTTNNEVSKHFSCGSISPGSRDASCLLDVMKDSKFTGSISISISLPCIGLDHSIISSDSIIFGLGKKCDRLTLYDKFNRPCIVRLELNNAIKVSCLFIHE